MYFFATIEGVRLDLEPAPHPDRSSESMTHCYHAVASVVGLAIIHIFGFDSPEALKLC